MGIIGKIKRRISDIKDPKYVRPVDMGFYKLKPPSKTYKLGENIEAYLPEKSFRYLRYVEHVPTDKEIISKTEFHFVNKIPTNRQLNDGKKIKEYKNKELHTKVSVWEVYLDRRGFSEDIMKLKLSLKKSGLKNTKFKELHLRGQVTQVWGYELQFSHKVIVVEKLLINLFKELGVKKLLLHPHDEPDVDQTTHEVNVSNLNLYDYDAQYLEFKLNKRKVVLEFGHSSEPDGSNAHEYVQFPMDYFDSMG